MRMLRSASLLVVLVGFPTTAPAQVQRAKLTASDMGQGDQFGLAVSISGNTALVGAPYDDDVADQSGAAYVYEWNGSGWAQVQKLKASDAGFGDDFGISVSIVGDLAVIGAYHDDSSGIAGAGSAYVFERVGGSWVETQKLFANDASQGAYFGSEASASADRLLISAREDGERGLNAGAAYVFDRIGGSWTQVAKLMGSQTTAFDHFGSSVALSGDRALVGAPSEGGAGTARGAAYLFERVQATWTETRRFVTSDGADSDYLGWSVGLDGSTALIGAIGSDEAASSAGAVYVFEDTGTSWVEIQKLTASDAAATDQFGNALAIRGDDAVIGALDDDDLGAQSGAAYHFRRNGSTWVQAGKALALDGHWNNLFGSSVSISLDRVLVGASFDNDACPTLQNCGSGSAYVFQIAPDVVQYCSCATNAPCGNTDAFGGCRHPLGYGAILSGGGSAGVALDELELHATSLPPNKFGFVFMSTAQSSVPAFNGLRCVGGGGAPLFRYPIQNSGALGRIVQGPGIVAWSQSHFPPAGRIAGTQTWNFQGWYRDPTGLCGATTNYTNAVQVAFHP